MYRTVLFDLDGTLLNTLRDLANAANWVCAQNGWPQHSLEEYKHFVGNGIPKLCERFSPPDARGPQRLARTLAAFEARYGAHKQDFTALYPGISELLAGLAAAGVSCGVLTNKEHRLAQAVVTHYFPDVFRFVQGAVPGIPTKPDPAGANALMAHMGAAPHTTLFVGDSDVDIFTAHNAGLRGCGVLWGFRGKKELEAAGADYLAAAPQELRHIILS